MCGMPVFKMLQRQLQHRKKPGKIKLSPRAKLHLRINRAGAHFHFEVRPFLELFFDHADFIYIKRACFAVSKLYLIYI